MNLEVHRKDGVGTAPALRRVKEEILCSQDREKSQSTSFQVGKKHLLCGFSTWIQPSSSLPWPGKICTGKNWLPGRASTSFLSHLTGSWRFFLLYVIASLHEGIRIRY